MRVEAQGGGAGERTATVRASSRLPSDSRLKLSASGRVRRAASVSRSGVPRGASYASSGPASVSTDAGIEASTTVNRAAVGPSSPVPSPSAAEV